MLRIATSVQNNIFSLFNVRCKCCNADKQTDNIVGLFVSEHLAREPSFFKTPTLPFASGYFLIYKDCPCLNMLFVLSFLSINILRVKQPFNKLGEAAQSCGWHIGLPCTVSSGRGLESRHIQNFFFNIKNLDSITSFVEQFL